MASARELLDQADALMRRNRGGAVDAEIPILTEVVPESDAADDADFPVLTDAVSVDDSVFSSSLQADGEGERQEHGMLLQHDHPSDDQKHGSPQYDDAVHDDGNLESDTQHAHVPHPGSIQAPVGRDEWVPSTEHAGGQGRRGDAPGEAEADPVLWLGPDTIDSDLPSVASVPSDWGSPASSMSFRAAGSHATPPPRGSEARNSVETASTGHEIEPRASTPQNFDDRDASTHTSLQAAAPEPHNDAHELFGHDPLSDEDVRGENAPDPESHEAQQQPDHTPDELADADLALSLHAVEGVEEGSAVAQPADPALDEELHWQAVAEQISMQVLQRIDLFTDSGLKVQLAAHLKPIVDRAGAELVASINDQVGRLLRTYVAEAIEREIAQWRDDNR